MAETEASADSAALASTVDDTNNAKASSEAARTTNSDNGDSEPVLRKLLEDLRTSEDGAKEANLLDEYIDEMVAQGSSEGLNMKLIYGQTLLHVAVRRELTEAVRRLVDAKADLDAQDSGGLTPLIEACWTGRIDIVKLLLDSEADSRISDNDGWSPLFIAARRGYNDIFQSLWSQHEGDINFEEKLCNRTLLHAAAYGGDEGIVRFLKSKGAKLSSRDGDGETPLMSATIYGQEAAMKELLKQQEGADLQLETRNSEGQTPLFRAAQDNFWNGVTILVEAGAKCDKSETPRTSETDQASVMASEEPTPLHFAVRKKKFEVVSLLLRKNANVNARDHEGRQPLHVASVANEDDGREQSISESETSNQVDQGAGESFGPHVAGYKDMVDLLLRCGADTKAKTKSGETAMELAFEHGHHDRANAIFDVFAEADDVVLDTELVWAAGKTERHWIATRLFERRSKLSSSVPAVNTSVESEHLTAIEWAAHANMPKVLWLLIASSPQSKETRKAIESARSIIERSKDQVAKPPANSEDQKREQRDDARKGGKSENIQVSLDMQDIIDNPPTGLICTDSPSYGLPTYDGKYSSSLRAYQAAIVRFYRKEAQFGNMIHSRTVEDTVYLQGPKKIIEHSSLLGKRIAQPSIFVDSQPSFTWIHLPATNMVWMDNLVQRIMKDEEKDVGHFNQAKSFFRDSWIEIPDKTSPSRMMRPRFVSRGAVLRDPKDGGARAKDPEKTSKKSSNNEKGTEMEGEDKGSKGEYCADGTEMADQNNKKLLDDPEEKAPTPAIAATAIYMPFLSYSFQCSETLAERLRSEEVRHKQEAKHGDNSEQEIEAEFAGHLLERRTNYEKLLKKYEGSIIHGSSTLDESYYYFGRDPDSTIDKNKRNRTQVATERWLKERERKQLERSRGEQQEQEEEDLY